MVSRKSSPSARGRVPTRGRCTRRNVLRSAATTLGSAILGACDAFSFSPGGGNRGNRESDLGDKEAPSLAKRVKKGDIPPLKDRLPEKPLVIEPTERPGTYGGEWRRALVGQPTAWLDRSIAYEGLVRWHPVNYTVVPNVAESVQPNSDGTHFRFTLRKGMKWSDGETYSAADIVFWYERVFLNDELTPVRPDWMMVEDEVATVEQVDDHTVDFTFPKPKGNFLDRLASQLRSGPTLSPQHYLEQFLPEINLTGSPNSWSDTASMTGSSCSLTARTRGPIRSCRLCMRGTWWRRSPPTPHMLKRCAIRSTGRSIPSGDSCHTSTGSCTTLSRTTRALC